MHSSSSSPATDASPTQTRMLPALLSAQSGQTLNPRVLAHLGDGVYELLVREAVLFHLGDIQAHQVHKATVALARAECQVQLLEYLQPDLTEEERALMKRARNSGVSVSRRTQQKLHREATALEALVGHWYLNTPDTLYRLSNWFMDYLERLFPLATSS
jgi:ribonuclease III family protein